MKVCVEDGIRKLVGASNRCVYKLGDCTKKMTVYLFLRTCRDVEKEINIAHTFWIPFVPFKKSEFFHIMCYVNNAKRTVI